MSNEKVKQNPIQINNNIIEKTNDMQMDISTYQEVFSIIRLLSNKYVYPNMPKKYIFKHLYEKIEIGSICKRGDEFPERLYFVPNGALGYSFISNNMLMELSTYNLEEILDYLYTPQQILHDFYLKLIKFSKERKQKIRNMKLALHFMKIIIENDEELRI